ncbi:hypothetical protein CHRYSEO8AT_300009 [Chryseobacterium sp. 8AT]|nr:hypothetical protein CHRYSEO8AT_300009 [Chryseobacterium sp. 8AT]
MYLLSKDRNIFNMFIKNLIKFIIFYFIYKNLIKIKILSILEQTVFIKL